VLHSLRQQSHWACNSHRIVARVVRWAGPHATVRVNCTANQTFMLAQQKSPIVGPTENISGSKLIIGIDQPLERIRSVNTKRNQMSQYSRSARSNQTFHFVARSAQLISLAQPIKPTQNRGRRWLLVVFSFFCRKWSQGGRQLAANSLWLGSN